MKFSRLVRLLLLVAASTWWASGARAQDPNPSLAGTWKLDRSQSESMREILKAQGYNAVEVGILERVPVTQVMSQTRDALSIEIRATVIRTSEVLRFDGQFHPDQNNVVGPVMRKGQWLPGGQQLQSVTRYNTRNGIGAEMTVTRSLAPGDRNRLQQETKLKLADGREFRVRQIFIRSDRG